MILTPNPFQLGLELYLSGTTGATGIGMQGLIGPQGNIGIQGPLGLPGAAGPVGGIGPIGLQGAQGSQGEKGNQGDVGYGVQGDVGVQGNQGDIGLQGTAGNAGSIGLQGPAGPSLTTTSYVPSLVSGANLTAVSGTSTGGYMTIGTTKFAWGSARWRWSNLSTTGGAIGNTPSISFPSGFFSTVYQFIPSIAEVGGELVQLVNGDLSGLNTVGNFVVYRPTASGSGVNYFFEMSFLAIGA